MKITEQTTLAELQAYLVTLGHPSLRINLRASHGYQANVYLTHVGAFNGDGNTHAEAIENALASLRSALGITNLAYEPLNYVREKSRILTCTRCGEERPEEDWAEEGLHASCGGRPQPPDHAVTHEVPSGGRRGQQDLPYASAPFAASLDGHYPMISRGQAMSLREQIIKQYLNPCFCDDVGQDPECEACQRVRGILALIEHDQYNRAVNGWTTGVRESIDKLYAAKASGVELTWGKISELLNILLQHPPIGVPPVFHVGGTPVTAEQLVNDSTYETFVPTAEDGHLIGEPLAQRLALRCKKLTAAARQTRKPVRKTRKPASATRKPASATRKRRSKAPKKP